MESSSKHKTISPLTRFSSLSLAASSTRTNIPLTPSLKFSTLNTNPIINPSKNPNINTTRNRNPSKNPNINTNRNINSSKNPNINTNRNINSSKNPNINTNRNPIPKNPTPKRTCMCSPTTHPGSFRCKIHRKVAKDDNNDTSRYMQNNSLNARRSAMVNSVVRIGTVEGDLMKRALASLIRPSLHQQRRRDKFQPKKSRLSVMSKAEDL